MEGLNKQAAIGSGALSFAPYAAQGLIGLGGRMKPPFNLVLSNVPGPLEPQHLAGSELEMMAPEALDELEKEVGPTTARRVRAKSSPKQ